MKKIYTSLVLLTFSMLLSGNGFSHHSVPVHFNPDESISVTGVVTRFSFRNPHGIVYFDVSNEQGELISWKAETNSPNILRRRGWDKEILVEGDSITIDGLPSRDGSPHMRLTKVTFADGRVLTPAGLD